MKNNKTNIDIIVLDDNDFYKHALVKELRRTIQKHPLGSSMKFNFYTYSQPELFIKDLKDDHFKNKNTIAFVDFYLGDGINGKHVIKLLQENNKNIKTILLSQSHNIIFSFRKKAGATNEIDFIAKDQFTFTICSLFLEQYIESKENQYIGL